VASLFLRGISVFNGLSWALEWKQNTDARRIVGKRRSLFKGVLLVYNEWLSVGAMLLNNCSSGTNYPAESLT
jgi:hypothetical protein